MVMSTFFVLKREWSSWEHLVETIKIVSLSWNLSRLIVRILRIQWRCSVFLFLLCYYLFWTNMVQKIKIARLNWNLKNSTQIWRIQLWCSLFLFLNGSILFKLKLVCGSWNLEPIVILNMYNSIVIFILFFFRLEIPFLG